MDEERQPKAPIIDPRTIIVLVSMACITLLSSLDKVSGELAIAVIISGLGGYVIKNGFLKKG